MTDAIIRRDGRTIARALYIASKAIEADDPVEAHEMAVVLMAWFPGSLEEQERQDAMHGSHITKLGDAAGRGA